MFKNLKKIILKILKLSKQLDSYEKDSVVQALPSFAYVSRAKKCIEKQEYDKAEKILEEAMELPQEDALVYKYLGVVCERTGRLHDAVIAYKKSANLNSSDKEIWRFLGFALMNCNQAEEALESFENANKINPANTDVFAGWGMALMKIKRYEEAHEKFMESVRLNRYNFMALLLAAIMEVRLERYNDAESKLNFLANVSPNETNAYEYANLKYIKKDYDSAIHYAQKALSFNEYMLPVYLLLGKLFAIKGKQSESLSMYEKAEALGLITPHLYFDWGVTLQIYEEYEKSEECFEKALGFSYEVNEIKAGLALISAIRGELEKAKGILSELNGVPDDNYLLTKTLGVIALNEGDYDNAIKSFKSNLDKMFFDNTLNIFLAEAYDKKGDINNAKEYYEAALLNGADNISIYLKYVDFLIRQEEYASAQRKLKRALKLNSDNLQVLNLLFHIGYILVKENCSEYNIKETLSIADKIMSIDSDAFNYPEERTDLESIANNR